LRRESRFRESRKREERRLGERRRKKLIGLLRPQ